MFKGVRSFSIRNPKFAIRNWLGAPPIGGCAPRLAGLSWLRTNSMDQGFRRRALWPIELVRSWLGAEVMDDAEFE